MKTMKSSLALAALSLGLLGVTGCANLQPPAPAAPPPAPAPEEVSVIESIGGVLVTIYHPDTRTAYLWYGDPGPKAKHPMGCVKIQIGADPAGTPKSYPCPK